jgi:hypothetical protein
MPAIITLGGIALSVLGLVIAIAGMPDRAAGLALGSDLIHTGATVFVGGLVVAALGQVLRALRDVGERIEDAGLGQAGPRPALNDGAGDRAPMPLPRATRNQPAEADDDHFAEEPAAPPPSRAPRGQQPASRGQQPAPRASLTPEASRPQQRMQSRPAHQDGKRFENEARDEFADEFAELQDERPAPRWMRAQGEVNNREPNSRPHEPGTIPLQSNRASRAAPQPSRREAPPVVAPDAYDTGPRRRPAQAPEPELEDHGHAEPTVVRSGIIAGMAYTLYSDRSIEAELPSGTVRFDSIEELQEHVKRSGVDDHNEYREPNAAPH